MYCIYEIAIYALRNLIAGKGRIEAGAVLANSRTDCSSLHAAVVNCCECIVVSLVFTQCMTVFDVIPSFTGESLQGTFYATMAGRLIFLIIQLEQLMRSLR